jgi:hypothetical protein
MLGDCFTDSCGEGWVKGGGGGAGLKCRKGSGGRGSVRVYINDRGQRIGGRGGGLIWRQYGQYRTAVSLCNRHTSSIQGGTDHLYTGSRATYTGGTLLLYGGHAPFILVVTYTVIIEGHDSLILGMEGHAVHKGGHRPPIL